MMSYNERSADTLYNGFEGLPWQVHKFGGTSVADADCYLTCARIIEEQIGIVDDQDHMPSSKQVHLSVVVSAMGGKPKTTDLLLDCVKYAAGRLDESVEDTLSLILKKHKKCLKALFEENPVVYERLVLILDNDVEDIRDILKTVALMKWQAERISELVSGYGELWSAQILTALMQQRSITRTDKLKENSSSSLESAMMIESHEFCYLDARRVITVDEDAIQNGAVSWELSQEKMKQVYKDEAKNLAEGQVLHFIVTGYVACNTEGVSTTLKRDGSDYSAAIMGRILQSNFISIWTDVDGVLSADPRRVPTASVVSEVSYNEAMELAYFGAKVIHPKTMQPAISSNPQIPIYIRNTFNSAFRGTRIYTGATTNDDDDEKVVCGFSSIEKMAIIQVEGSGLVGVPGVAKRMFGTLEQIGVNVVLISQASSEHSVCFATLETQAQGAKEALEEEFSREIKQNRVSTVDVVAPCSIISAVGDSMAKTTGVAGRFFSALGDAKVNILAIAQGSSKVNISAVVLSEHSTRALRAVHAAFRLSHTGIRVGIVGMNELGTSLLKLLDSQRGAVRARFDIDLQVCAVLEKGVSKQLVALKREGTFDSVTAGSFKQIVEGTNSEGSHRTAFKDEQDTVTVLPWDLTSMLDAVYRDECTNHVIFDCTNDEIVGTQHASWLRAGVDVVTANNTGISGPKAQRDEIRAAQRLYGKQSAKYSREVTVGGGLPIISTLRTLLQSGDKIRRVDGILSVSLSYIMFRVSPPPDITLCSNFDEGMSKGAFVGDLLADVGKPCSFSQAVDEAVRLGLMEEDHTHDLNNEYISRVMIVLARELGMDNDLELEDVQKASEKVLESTMKGPVDYTNLSEEINVKVKERVDAARSRGCVLRQISFVDVKEKEVGIKLEEVPEHHIFAVTPPSCECVRFFTQRHRAYPLIVQGPTAGADSTASALLAELLHLMRGKASPRTLALSRSGNLAMSRSGSATTMTL